MTKHRKRPVTIESLRAELEDSRKDIDYFRGWAEGNGHRLNDALATIECLRAELERTETERDEAREQCTEMEQQYRFAQEEAQGRLAMAARDNAEQPTKASPTPFECEPSNRCNRCAVCWS